MAYEIEYSEIDEKSKSEIADLDLKLLAVEQALVDLQNERANFEVTLRDKENALNIEKNTLLEMKRGFRKITLKDKNGNVVLSAGTDIATR